MSSPGRSRTKVDGSRLGMFPCHGVFLGEVACVLEVPRNPVGVHADRSRIHTPGPEARPHVHWNPVGGNHGCCCRRPHCYVARCREVVREGGCQHVCRSWKGAPSGLGRSCVAPPRRRWRHQRVLPRPCREVNRWGAPVLFGSVVPCPSAILTKGRGRADTPARAGTSPTKGKPRN